jgi:hypothetical protein
MKMSKNRKRCIFCTGFGLSKEHIWSRWTYALVPNKPSDTHARGHFVSSPGDPRSYEKRDIKNYQGNVNTIRLRVVCKTCNNGWMSRLDKAVKPILSPLILCDPVTLDERSQTLLSTWIAMKGMVAEQSRPEDAASVQDERALLMAEQRPPRNWQIWIARQTGRLWRVGYQRRASTLGYLDGEGIAQSPDGSLAKNTYSMTLGIGQLLINVVSTRVPELKFSFQDTTVGRAMHRIQPYERDIEWPPAQLLNGAQADQVAGAFDRYTNTLKWRAGP